MQPIVDGLESEYGDRLAFEHWLADREPGRALFQEYGLRGHPGYVIVGANGRQLWTFQGQTTAEMLSGQIDQVLTR